MDTVDKDPYDHVDKTYADFLSNKKIMIENGEASLANDYENMFAKVILLSCASCFEVQVIKSIHDALETDKNELIKNFIEKKALKRQYHTLFDWEKKKAEPFFALFGPDFKDFAKDLLKTDSDLKSSVDKFLELGYKRNLLVHNDYASFQLNDTAEDIYSDFTDAKKFVSKIKDLPSLYQQKSQSNN